VLDIQEISTNDIKKYQESSTRESWCYQHLTNDLENIDITGWTKVSDLPEPLYNFQAITTKNYVYLLGGLKENIVTKTVYTATINNDGTLGGWISVDSLPEPLYAFKAIVIKNRVYLLGGNNSSFKTVSTVYTTTIDDDGILGNWSLATSLPIPLSFSQVVVTKNRVYLIGGYNGINFINSIYAAKINSDGTLENWEFIDVLPKTVYIPSVIIIGNRVYLTRGLDGLEVYTTTINDNGRLGLWTVNNFLPDILACSQAIVTKNRVYLLGGRNNSTIVDTVFTAPINTDGTLGLWTTDTPLPTPLSSTQAVVTNRHIYLLGGYGKTGSVSSIFMANF